MGYGNSAPTADAHLREKIKAAITSAIVPLIDDTVPGPTTGTGALANEINANPKPIYDRLFTKLKAVDGITVESTDAELNTAILNADSLDLMYQFYGISPT